jgi:hypothetical protein
VAYVEKKSKTRGMECVGGRERIERRIGYYYYYQYLLKPEFTSSTKWNLISLLP